MNLQKLLLFLARGVRRLQRSLSRSLLFFLIFTLLLFVVVVLIIILILTSTQIILILQIIHLPHTIQKQLDRMREYNLRHGQRHTLTP